MHDTSFVRVADHLAVGVCVLAPDGTITYANPAMGQLLEQPVMSIIGSPFDDPSFEIRGLDGSPIPSERLPFPSVRRNLQPVQGFEHVVALGDEQAPRVIGVDMNPLVDPGGRFEGAVALVQDVTGRVQARTVLHESERRFRELAEHSPEAMFLQQLRPERRVLYVNPMLEKLTGHDRDRLLADPGALLGAVHDDDREVLTQQLTSPDVMADPVQIRFQRTDGAVRHVLVRAMPLFDAAGQLTAVQAAGMDVTEQREQAAAQLELLERRAQAAAELERLDELKTTFVRAVSHELRTPLTSVVGFAELLRMHGAELDVGRQQELLDRILAAARRLERLLDDVFDLDRLERPGVDTSLVPTDLLALAHRVVEANPSTSHEVRVVGDPVVVEVDPPLFERAIDNLLRNALRHTPHGTGIVIEVEPDPAITVRDDGPGVDREIAETLFEPFVQGRTPSTSPHPGTGIGLALVQRIALLHRWVVTLEPASRGAAFRLAPDGVAPDGVAPGGVAPGGVAPGGVAPGGVAPPPA